MPSWRVGRVEAHFGPLRQFTVAHPNHPVQTRALHRYLIWHRQNARHPDALAAQRRERVRILGERRQRWGRPRPEAA